MDLNLDSFLYKHNDGIPVIRVFFYPLEMEPAEVFFGWDTGIWIYRYRMFVTVVVIRNNWCEWTWNSFLFENDGIPVIRVFFYPIETEPQEIFFGLDTGVWIYRY